jgi:hypothetical protein
VEVEAACLVLDHDDCRCSASCPIDLICSLDLQLGSGHRDYPYRDSGFVRNARDPFRCREISGEAENLGKKMTSGPNLGGCVRIKRWDLVAGRSSAAVLYDAMGQLIVE